MCAPQVRDRLQNVPTFHRLAGVTLKCMLWDSWNLVSTMSPLFLSIWTNSPCWQCQRKRFSHVLTHLMWLCGWPTCKETPRHALPAQNPSRQAPKTFTQHFSTDWIEEQTPSTPTPAVSKFVGAKICPQQVRDRLRNVPTSHRLASVTLKCMLWTSWNLVSTMSPLFLSI